MVDFVGLLKRTIDAQSNATPALRRRIYDRTRDTVEKQMAGKAVAPGIQALQRRILEKAIDEVEAFYQNAAAAAQADVFAALQKNAGIRAPAPKPEAESGGGDFTARLSPYGFADWSDEESERREFGGGRAQGVPSFAEAPLMSEAAYGGGMERGGAAAGGQRLGERPSSALFQLEDEDESAAFAAAPARKTGAGGGNNGNRSGSGERGERREQSFAEPFYDEARGGAFARRSPDAPIPALPDFGEEFLPDAAEMRGGAYPRPSGLAAYDEAEAESAPSYDTETGFNAYGDTNRDGACQAAPLPYEPASAGGAADYSREETLREPAAAPLEENLAPEPSSAEQAERQAGDVNRDFSSLHNFLFGGGEPPEFSETEPPESYSPQRQDSYSPQRQSVESPDFAANAAPAPRAPRQAAAGGRAELEPLPDFLAAEADEAPAQADEGGAFDLERALAEKQKAQEQAPARPRGQAAQASFAPQTPLAPEFPGPAGGADVFLPENGKARAQASAPSAAEAGLLSGGAGSRIASGIFAQAAIQEKRRSGKRRLIAGGAVILALLLICGGIFWFLTDFLKNDGGGIASLVGKNPPAEAPKDKAVEKTNQRLTPDGHEIDAAPEPSRAAAPKAAAQSGGAGQSAAEEAALSAPQAVGDAVFREAQTALMPATEARGRIAWSLLHEKTPEGMEDTVLRGELTIPARDIIMRMTIRPNHDKGIPAVYLVELMFIVPENFEGVAIDKISPLLFKATDHSTGQELLDTRVYKINDNFFVVTLNAPEDGRNPKLQRNIALMEQLPWLSMNVAYKNGRIGEFTFAKSDKGEALFKQFFDAQTAANQGLGQSVKPAAPAR